MPFSYRVTTTSAPLAMGPPPSLRAPATRRVSGARSENGAAIAKGVEVVITRYENGLAYVRTWDEFAADQR